MNFKRYSDKNINKIGILDIETQGQGFDAQKGFMISWVLKIYNIKTRKSVTWYDIIDKNTFKRINRLMDQDKNKKIRKVRPYDKELLKSLIPKMQECDLIVTHYGTWFDIPFIRTRAKMQNIPFIKHSDKIRFSDTWKIARTLYKFPNNKLDTVARVLGVKGAKTLFDLYYWDATTRGNLKALRYTLKHNFIDVDITFRIWKKIEESAPVSARYY